MDATARFFEQLAERGHVEALEKATGTIGVELQDDGKAERWLVTLDKGDVAVSHRAVAADCTVATSKELFNDLVQGRANAMSSVIRGAIDIEGDSELLVLFQRLFPGPGSAAEGSEA
jgi:hypothetical protein